MGLPNIAKYSDSLKIDTEVGKGDGALYDSVGPTVERRAFWLDRFFHSVTLDSDKCVGCTNCIKRCPTEAIRVRNGKAHIISERCIDCGECIRVCPHHAKKANSDPLESIGAFEYKIGPACPQPVRAVQ